jgi:transposase-like protein
LHEMIPDVPVELPGLGGDYGGARCGHGAPTIMRWVQRQVPEFEQRWQRYARPVGTSWRIDVTYLIVKGKGVYLYRAVDRAGLTVDFLLSEHRAIAAAKRFFRRAIELHRTIEE